MSTRATIRFATREEGVTFNEHPKKWNAQFYKHHDGYPEGLGVDLASCIVKEGSWNAVNLAAVPLLIAVLISVTWLRIRRNVTVV